LFQRFYWIVEMIPSKARKGVKEQSVTVHVLHHSMETIQ
jgi:hypothetical protein